MCIRDRRTPNGETVLDFGQNMAGYVEMKLTAHAGQKIKLLCGEALDENGNFTPVSYTHLMSLSEKSSKLVVRYNTEEICFRKVSFTVSNFFCWGGCPAAVRAAFSRSSFI